MKVNEQKCFTTLLEVNFNLLNKLKLNFDMSDKHKGKKFTFSVKWSKFYSLTIQAITH